MNQRQSLVGTMDRVGIIASAICFIHCIAPPIVVSLMAVYAHLLPAEETTHRILAILVTILGAETILSGYQKHKRRSILMLMVLGLTLISAGALFGDRLLSHGLEVAIMLAGSICMITAHRQNHTFCIQCTTCT